MNKKEVQSWAHSLAIIFIAALKQLLNYSIYNFIKYSSISIQNLKYFCHLLYSLKISFMPALYSLNVYV